MKPDKSYLSLYKGKARATKFLFILFAVQILLLSLLSISIPVPVEFAEKLLEDYETKDITFELEQVAFTFPDKITARKVVLLKNGHQTGLVHELKIQYPFLKLPWGKWRNLKHICAKNISLQTPVESQPVFQLTNFDLQKSGDMEHDLKVSIHSGQSLLKVKGVVDFEYLKSLLKATPLKEPHFQLSESVDRLLRSGGDLKTILQETGSLDLETFLNISPNGDLSLSQLGRDTGEETALLNGLRAYLQIFEQDEGTRIASIKANLKDLTIKQENIVTVLRNISFSNQSISFEHLNTLKNNFGKSSLRVDGIELKGKVEGRLPALDIISNSSDELEKGMVFSESNRTRVALAYQYDSFVSLHGDVSIDPKLFDLYCNTKKGRLRVIDGDECTLSLLKRKVNERAFAPMHFRVTAPRLSVMEAPDGSFSLQGMIYPDYSITVDSAWAKIGKSEASGTYSQSWFPHNFRFLLKGELFPPDISNWFGSWWKSIWTDFRFSEKTPSGDFSVSGAWGSSSSDTITFGIIKTQKLTYRNFTASQSSAIVKTDSNQTSVHTIIKHKKGQLRGNFSFPRNSPPEGEILSFDFNGDYPLNDGRQTFGPEVERYLIDFNSTNLLCEVSGSIFRSLNDASGESNKTHYKIKISTDQNASLWNIPTEHIHGGEITYKNRVTSGKFPSIGLGNGIATLDFKSENQAGSKVFDFNFNLRGADRTALISSISKAKHLNPDSRNHILENIDSSKESNGKIDLRIDARGPFGNFLQFTGTGHIRLIEESLQKVNLLGKISERLDAVKLPIPSGSFSFEMLEIPFRLENENVHSDKILLTGPLSRIEASGALNLASGEIDVTSTLKLIGNLKIPILKNILNLADPLSKITEIRITGHWKNPKTEFITSLEKILPFRRRSK